MPDWNLSRPRARSLTVAALCRASRLGAVAILAAVSLFAADSGIRPEIARLLPPEAVTIGGFDIQAVRDTPLFSRLASRFPIHGDEQLDQIFAIAGFDYKRDIHRILAAGTGQIGTGSKASLVVLEGRFDIEGDAQGLLSLFQPVGEHHGITLYKTVSDHGNPNDSTFAFLDPRTVAIATGPEIEAAIGRWVAGAEPSGALRAALSQKGAHVWAATLEPNNLFASVLDHVPGGAGPLQALADSVETLSIRGTARGSTLEAEMAFQCATAEDARSLADAAQTLAGFAALTTMRQRPELADLLGRVRVRHDGIEATLSVDLTEAQLARFGPR